MTRLHRPCGVLLWQARPSILPRLESLLARVRRTRSNLYPEGWDADPLRWVERELEALLEDIL